ncbi:hypothetical protein [Streptomyces smyrnaeus]|uniref:hypothetical protein n=1 Tax=Streptomyces smyrnaeus TaxID=1387713 RepID=UPI0033C01F75
MHAKSGKAGKKVIALAGESRYDRQVLRHLIPALHPGRCPEFVEIKKSIKLSQATTQLTPRVDELRRLAQSQAKLKNAALVGVALHVDLDRVTDDKYTRDRETIAAELRRAFTCQSALALAAVEMEAWLLLFPKAFTKFQGEVGDTGEGSQAGLRSGEGPEEVSRTRPGRSEVQRDQCAGNHGEGGQA